MSKKKSRFNTRFGSTIGWDNIDRFAVRGTYRIHPQTKNIRRKQKANKLAHDRDRERQELEKGINWSMVAKFLDMGLSLLIAKRLTLQITGDD